MSIHWPYPAGRIHYDNGKGATFGAKGNLHTKDGHCYRMRWDDEACESVVEWCYIYDEDFIDAMRLERDENC